MIDGSIQHCRKWPATPLRFMAVPCHDNANQITLATVVFCKLSSGTIEEAVHERLCLAIRYWENLGHWTERYSLGISTCLPTRLSASHCFHVGV